MASEAIRRVREASRYSVHPKYITALPEYESVLNNINMSGGYIYHIDNEPSAVCYSAYLIVLFRQEYLPVWDSIEKQDTTLDADILFKSFVEGFDDGMSYFDQNYDIPSKMVYSSPEYVKTIKQLYYGDGSKWPDDHCLKVIRFCPITLEIAQFKKIGHWSAITFCIENLMQKHPGTFINASTQTTEDSPTPSLRQVALIRYYTKCPINERNKKEIAAEYGYKGTTAGYKLYKEHYLEILDSKIRTTGRDSVKDIRFVIDNGYLSGNSLEVANDDLTIAESKKP